MSELKEPVSYVAGFPIVCGCGEEFAVRVTFCVRTKKIKIEYKKMLSVKKIKEQYA